MKVKIRGLVFAGFAAAVFAQNALAEISEDDKTVTSKTYVDSKVEATVSGETTINSESPDDKAPSSLNVYKFVTDQMDDLSEVAAIQGDGTYLNVTTETVGTGNNQHDVKQVNVITGNLASTAALISAGGASGASALAQGKLTTAKAVYDFVVNGDPNDPNNPEGFQRKISETEANVLYTNTNINGVNENGAVEIGYRPYNATTQEYGDSTWGVLKPAADSSDGSAQGYIVFRKDTSKLSWDVNINQDKIAGVYADIDTAGGNSATNAQKGKLTTAKAVYDYAVKKNWTQANAGKNLVVGSDGIVTVSDNVNPDIPQPTNQNCAAAGGTSVCALVAYWDTTLNNGTGGVRYEWTVMATSSSNNNG